ncbi:MAG TPA: hypothetical protein VKA26_00995 [Ignavibacteriaceae bacterium]|nr:hypothetical protein [Ignavibacteriaceae bacterium]
MFDLIIQSGILGWPMALIALGNIFLTVKYSIKLFGSEKQTKVDLNKIIILGVLALSLGIFSHVLGLYQGLQVYSYLSADQVAGGYAASLVALMLGMGIFVISAILWFLLRSKLNCELMKASK